MGILYARTIHDPAYAALEPLMRGIYRQYAVDPNSGVVPGGVTQTPASAPVPVPVLAQVPVPTMVPLPPPQYSTAEAQTDSQAGSMVWCG